MTTLTMSGDNILAHLFHPDRYSANLLRSEFAATALDSSSEVIYTDMNDARTGLQYRNPLPGEEGEIAMTDPSVDPLLNLEAESLDELERKVSPEQSDETTNQILRTDHPAPVAGHTCRRQSQQSELGACDFGDVVN